MNLERKNKRSDDILVALVAVLRQLPFDMSHSKHIKSETSPDLTMGILLGQLN
jgi:hypothetical protein